MENPNLTTLTPTLLAGDRSLANVLCHEAVHSWSGNLVTNATWSDFWLNEGCTVFIERRIISKLFGPRVSAMKQRAGWAALEMSVQRFGQDHEFTRLNIPMDGIDPDDSFSSVSYEKGCALFCHLEATVGGPAIFEPFIKAYFCRFQFGTVSSPEFKAFFLQYFAENKAVSKEALESIDWEAWYAWYATSQANYRHIFD
jgi:leukotriene-A4 hydrolase